MVDALCKKMFGGNYDDLWKAVIRPQRDEYEISELGPKEFTSEGRKYKRNDFQLKNKRNLTLQCSMWEPVNYPAPQLPCVIYLHGNASSRIEAVSEVKNIIRMGVTFVAFDFSGSGHSEGKYISLGWYERQDVECVVTHLRKTNKISTIGLWGRSMGAVTALMYGQEDQSVAGVLFDSPFSSLIVLVKELVESKIKLPGFVLNQAVKMVSKSIEKEAGFKLTDIEPIKYAEKCFIPGLFCHGKGDDFVLKHHSEDLMKVYQGEKKLMLEEGEHNTQRSKFFRDSAAIFFHNCLMVDKITEIQNMYSENQQNRMGQYQRYQQQYGMDIIGGDENGGSNNWAMPVDPYEEELKRVLELSKKEYEEQQKQHNNGSSSNNNNNTSSNNNDNNILIDDDIQFNLTE